MNIASLETAFIKMQFGAAQRVRIYNKLVRYLKNGVSVLQGLETMYAHASQDGKKPKAAAAVVLDSWMWKMRNGKPLGDAIEGWVPDADRLVIKAGENSGDLAGAIENAIMLHNSQKQIKAAVVGGIAYPIVLIIVIIGFMVMFGTQVVPAFDTAYPKENWTGTGAQMAWLADFVQSGLIPSIFGMIALVGLILWSMPRWTGKVRSKVDSFAPYSIYRLVAGASFLLSLAAMLKAGVKIETTLRMMQSDAKPWYAERVTKALQWVNNGKDIGEALYLAALNFPDQETINDLRSYARLEGFDEMLMKIGKDNLSETVTKIQAQSAVMKNFFLILLGFVFVWIGAGIFSVQQQVMSGVGG